MRLKGWRSEVALADITGYVVVTRCTDPANNTDKYRRFITLSTPVENHLHIQHTGRWTQRTDMGRWIEGVWRPQGVAKTTTQRTLPDCKDYNDEMVRRKIGAYRVVQDSRMLTGSEIADIIQRAELEDTNPAPAAVNPAPATRPISGQPSKQSVDVTASVQAQVASTPVPAPGSTTAQATQLLGGVAHDALAEQVANLLARAAAGTEDEFDLFADLAVIKRQVKAVVDQARELEDQLRLATETIMAKVGA